jgi:uncharacterized membrane protein YfcA
VVDIRGGCRTWGATAIGARIANRLPEQVLRPTFVVLILAMAAYMAT